MEYKYIYNTKHVMMPLQKTSILFRMNESFPTWVFNEITPIQRRGRKCWGFTVLFDRFVMQKSIIFHRKLTSKPQNFLGRLRRPKGNPNPTPMT